MLYGACLPFSELTHNDNYYWLVQCIEVKWNHNFSEPDREDSPKDNKHIILLKSSV